MGQRRFDNEGEWRLRCGCRFAADEYHLADDRGPCSTGCHADLHAGNIFSLVIVDRTATPEEVTGIEAWVAAKTGVTLP